MGVHRRCPNRGCNSGRRSWQPPSAMTVCQSIEKKRHFFSFLCQYYLWRKEDKRKVHEKEKSAKCARKEISVLLQIMLFFPFSDTLTLLAQYSLLFAWIDRACSRQHWRHINDVACVKLGDVDDVLDFYSTMLLSVILYSCTHRSAEESLHQPTRPSGTPPPHPHPTSPTHTPLK